MKDVKASESQTDTARKIPATQPRAAYTPPVLHIYGSVSKLTMAKAGSLSDAGMPMIICDRSTKENIVRIGTHPLGIGLYLFDYKSEYRAAAGYGRKMGVMADEVETVVPAAVVVHPDGYKMVDYAMLAQAQAAQAVH
jgi:hypothetical protein